MATSHRPKSPPITGFLIGDRVQTHPATDAWMFGDRYGEVTAIGRVYIHVRMERSGRTLRFVPADLINI